MRGRARCDSVAANTNIHLSSPHDATVSNSRAGIHSCIPNTRADAHARTHSDAHARTHSDAHSDAHARTHSDAHSDAHARTHSDAHADTSSTTYTHSGTYLNADTDAHAFSTERVCAWLNQRSPRRARCSPGDTWYKQRRSRAC